MQSITIPLVCTGWAYWTFISSEGTALKLLSADTLIGAMVPQGYGYRATARLRLGSGFG